jgi:hypothetical protein
MVPQQHAPARVDEFAFVPIDVAVAATRYQTFREVESAHLALMAQHNLLDDWTADVRASVLAARERVREAREARAGFRDQVRDFVRALRTTHEPLPAALRHTRVMLQLLEGAGAIQSDDGWLEAEVLEWVMEDYDIIS